MAKRASKLRGVSRLIVAGVCLLLTWSTAGAQPRGAAAPDPNLPTVPDAARNPPIGSPAAPQGELSPVPMNLGEDTPIMVEEEHLGPDLPADCGLGCSPTWYAQADAFYLSNEGSGPLSLSNDFVLSEFAYDLGTRVTLGRKRDCLEGWEVSFVGPFRWERTGEIDGALLSSKFAVPAGDVDISAFNQAAYHRQTYESTLASLEISERYWDWNTMSWLWGLRYLNVDEEFTFFSRDPLPAADEGFFAVDTENHLLGAQGGLEVFYPLGSRNALTIGARTKLGLYANLASGDVLLINAGQSQLNNGDDEVQLAFLGELGFFAKLRLTRRLSARAGYEVWYLTGLAQAPGQTVSPLGQRTGSNLDSESDCWYHGGTVGLEFAW